MAVGSLERIPFSARAWAVLEPAFDGYGPRYMRRLHQGTAELWSFNGGEGYALTVIDFDELREGYLLNVIAYAGKNLRGFIPAVAQLAAAAGCVGCVSYCRRPGVARAFERAGARLQYSQYILEVGRDG